MGSQPRENSSFQSYYRNISDTCEYSRKYNFWRKFVTFSNQMSISPCGLHVRDMTLKKKMFSIKFQYMFSLESNHYTQYISQKYRLWLWNIKKINFWYILHFFEKRSILAYKHIFYCYGTKEKYILHKISLQVPSQEKTVAPRFIIEILMIKKD